MTREPARQEVLGWLALTGRSQSEAIDHFWPGAADDERRRIEARVRQWVKRARDAGMTGLSQPLHGPPPAMPPPPPVQPPPRPPEEAPNRQSDDDDEQHEAVPLTRMAFLERQLSQLLQLLDVAIESRQIRLVPQLDKRVSDVFDQLEAARERERRVVRLDPTPAAISAELAKREKAIALRAEIHRRNAERAALPGGVDAAASTPGHEEQP